MIVPWFLLGSSAFGAGFWEGFLQWPLEWEVGGNWVCNDFDGSLRVLVMLGVC